jgi:hypothetical protein
MFGSIPAEFTFGLVLLALAAVLWRFLLRAFRRQPLPLLLRSEMAAPLSTVVEVGLLAFGCAALIDATAKLLP